MYIALCQIPEYLIYGKSTLVHLIAWCREEQQAVTPFHCGQDLNAIWLPLQWRHDGHDGVSNISLTIVYSTVYSGADQRKHQSSASLAGEFPAQMASYAENVSIWWRHHVIRSQWLNWNCSLTSSRNMHQTRFCIQRQISVNMLLLSHPWLFNEMSSSNALPELNANHHHQAVQQATK